MAFDRVVLIAAVLLAMLASSPMAEPKFSGWSAPVNLGPLVNSASNDLGPAISKDGLSLYFGSNRPGGAGGMDLWVSQRADIDALWGAAVNLGPTVNSPATENVPAFSRDGHWMFFNSNRPGGFGDTDIWVSWRTNVHDDFGWQPPVNLGPDVNSTSGDSVGSYFENEEAGPPLLFLSSNRPFMPPTPGGPYVSALGSSGLFGAPTLVTELDSPADEMRPMIRADGLEILLASARSGTFGGRDLWAAERGTVFDNWFPPVNLGSVVNSASNELTPYLSSDRRLLFLASDRPGGVGAVDLYVTWREKIHDRQDR